MVGLAPGSCAKLRHEDPHALLRKRARPGSSSWQPLGSSIYGLRPRGLAFDFLTVESLMLWTLYVLFVENDSRWVLVKEPFDFVAVGNGVHRPDGSGRHGPGTE
jgi:hypothetical protein